MARNEIQRLYLGSEADPVAASNVEAGSYTLTLGAETTASISYDDDAAAIQAALESLANIGAGNVEVTAETDGFTIEFIGDLANQPIDELVVTPTGMVQKADTVTVDVIQEGIADDPTLVNVSEHTAAVAPVQEVQRITFTGTPDSGSWTINGVTVSGGASAGNLDVEAAIQDSGGFNKGCSVTGNFAGDFVITFDTPEPLSEIVVDTSALLDSGSSPVANDVTTNTEGSVGVHQKTEITFDNVPDDGSVTLSNSVVIEFTDNSYDIDSAWTSAEAGVVVTGSIVSGSVIVEYAYDDYSSHTIPTVSTNTMVVAGQPHIVTVELTDEPTEGQWEMNAGSTSSGFLDWDATTNEVETEFEAMAYGYPVTVTGYAGWPWTIESDDNVTATIEAQEGDGGQPLRKSVGVEIVTVQEGEPLPDAPSGLTATAISSSRIDLEWVDESDNETGFRVEKSLAGEDDWSLVSVASANATSISATGLMPVTEYDFRVRANGVGGNSDWSETATAETLEAPAISGSGQAVVTHDTGMTVECPNQRVTVEWDADGTGEASGEIQLRGILANVSFQPSAENQPSNNYDVYLYDDAGFDVLNGAGVNLSNTTPKRIAPAIDTTIYVGRKTSYDRLTVDISGAGSGGRGTIRFYLRCY